LREYIESNEENPISERVLNYGTRGRKVEPNVGRLMKIWTEYSRLNRPLGSIFETAAAAADDDDDVLYKETWHQN
jgi:hypothetical protein